MTSVITAIEQQYGAECRYVLEPNAGASVEYVIDVVIGCIGNNVGPMKVLEDPQMTNAGLVLGLPYSSYFYGETDIHATLCEINLSRLPMSINAYSAKCVYRSIDPRYNQPNPFACAPVVETEHLPYQVPLVYDMNGQAVLNSAGDLFDPPPARDQNRTAIKITRNEPFYDDSFARSLQDNVNSDSLNGAEPKTLKIAKISAFPGYSAGYGQFWRVTYELHYDPNKWTLKLIDAGYQSFSGGVKQAIVLEDGNRPSSPVLLDGAGGMLTNPTPADAVQLEFDIYPQIALSAFNFATVNFGGGWG